MENRNQPAFPRAWSKIKQSEHSPELIASAQKGLTKREYFAAMAMQGLMSNSRVIVNDIDNIKQCILIADELIKQLETN